MIGWAIKEMKRGYYVANNMMLEKGYGCSIVNGMVVCHTMSQEEAWHMPIHMFIKEFNWLTKGVIWRYTFNPHVHKPGVWVWDKIENQHLFVVSVDGENDAIVLRPGSATYKVYDAKYALDNLEKTDFKASLEDMQ